MPIFLLLNNKYDKFKLNKCYNQNLVDILKIIAL